MKKIILISLLLGCILARGQEYSSLLTENKVWSIGHEKHTLIGDTIINDITYQKLFFHNYLAVLTPDSLKYIAALREDTINKKVYFIWKGFTSEVLLYDFSLNIDDSFQAKSPEFYLDGPFYFEHDINPRHLRVSMVIDSLVAGKTRRVLKLSRPQESHILDYWIEGIGSPFGLIYAGYEMIPDKEYPFLLCLHENDLLVYQENDPYGLIINTCYAEPATYIKEFTDIKINLIISPNHFREKLNINSNIPLNEVIVYNLNGGIIYEYRASEGFGEQIINTLHWESGLYIVRAGNSQHFAFKKIIKL